MPYFHSEAFNRCSVETCPRLWEKKCQIERNCVSQFLYARCMCYVQLTIIKKKLPAKTIIKVWAIFAQNR